MKGWKAVALWLGVALALDLFLSGLDPSGPPFSAWLSYLALSLVAAGLLAGGWYWVAAADRPRWLAAALGVAFVLRLGVGLGLEATLPIWGYPDNKSNQAGYVFYDAFKRDNDAWALAASDKPLTAAFSPRYTSDQYGGLLLISATTYRLLGNHVHRPLMVVLLAAAVGALAVLFTWGFTAMTLGGGAAAVAAWIVALYPDAVLLGASQMREPFMIAGLAAALYGYARARIGDRRTALILIAVGTLFGLIVSPPFGVLIVATLLGAVIWERRLGGRRLTLVLAGAVLLVVGLALTFRAWSAIGGLPGSNIGQVILGWLTAGADYQLRLLQEQSGIVQKVFALTPAWAHIPLATLYGLTQPFLPAALADATVPAMWIVSIGRAVGWFAMIPFLIYGIVVSLRQARSRSLTPYLAALVVLVALIASYRAAGDQWDNPRYRTTFLAIQAAVAGWALIHARKNHNPWLVRIVVMDIAFVLIFLQWYAGRYLQTPSLGLNATLAAEAACMLGVIAWGLIRDRLAAHRIRRSNVG